MAMTMTQKILAKHAGLESVRSGQLIEAELDMILGNDITSPVAINEFKKLGIDKVFNRDKISIVPDHFTPNKDIKAAEQCKVVREFVKNASKVAQKIDIMFEKAAYDNKTVAVHFSVGEKESAIISHMQLNPVNITVNDNIITFEEGTAEHYIDISQFDSVKCDDECVNDIADATIDMMCDHWSVHFDILTI